MSKPSLFVIFLLCFPLLSLAEESAYISDNVIMKGVKFSSNKNSIKIHGGRILSKNSNTPIININNPASNELKYIDISNVEIHAHNTNIKNNNGNAAIVLIDTKKRTKSNVKVNVYSTNAKIKGGQKKGWSCTGVSCVKANKSVVKVIARGTHKIEN